MENEHELMLRSEQPVDEVEAIDPVCLMSVNIDTAKHQADHHGQPYYFCGANCKTKFLANPAKYLAAEKAVEPVIAGAIYICPMHPQIQQVGPGTCPICGMALEPLTVTADSGPNLELIDMTRRLWIGLTLAIPVLVLEMGGQITGLTMLLGQQLSNWVQLFLATPVVLWAGWPFFERGWQSLNTRNLNMFTLIAIALQIGQPVILSDEEIERVRVRMRDGYGIWT